MRARMAWFNPAYKGKIVFPYWMQFFDFLSTILRTPIPLFEKVRCYLYMAKWFLDHFRNLIGDLVLAIIAIFRNPELLYVSRNRGKDIYNWE